VKSKKFEYEYAYFFLGLYEERLSFRKSPPESSFKNDSSSLFPKTVPQKDLFRLTSMFFYLVCECGLWMADDHGSVGADDGGRLHFGALPGQLLLLQHQLLIT
jgi:hypothetical protein